MIPTETPAMDEMDPNVAVALEAPSIEAPLREPSPGPRAEDRLISILGVAITDVDRRRAIELVEEMIRGYGGRARSVFLVNAHTLNLAAADEEYRRVLNSATYVFGDGTGVRWAARLQGIRVRDNLVGTDFVPELFRATAGRGYRYFLLGADQQTIRLAARHAAETFPGWTQAGWHHGYLGTEGLTRPAIRQINQAEPDMLLVGMGNPRQEQWIHAHQRDLRVPVCLGIGGLFDYWAGNVTRAPAWLRRCGHEWLWRLWQQPRDKAMRYLVGNPLFLLRILREHRRRR
jgi:N-acetylglucosaminyldiphosphoundecaprenol N-acetyl-beta-D-mannosaminyltransferase